MFKLGNSDMFTVSTCFAIGKAIRKEIERFSQTGASAAKGGMITGVLSDVPVIGLDKPFMNVFAVCRYKILDGEIQGDPSCLYVFVFDEMPDEVLDFHLSLKRKKC